MATSDPIDVQPRTLAWTRGLVALVGLAGGLFLAGTYLAPILVSAGEPFGTLLHLFYAPACHQDPHRSFAVADSVQAVCARCSGLYIGGVLGLLAGLVWVGRRWGLHPIWFFALLAPTGIDAVLPWFGLPQFGMVGRQWISIPGGLITGLFLSKAIQEIVASWRRARVPEGLPADGAEEAHG